MNQMIVAADAEGPVLACAQGLSLWGGVDPETGTILDAHHDQCGQTLAGKIVVMPTSRGSCSGSSVLLQLMLGGAGPKALVFSQPDSVLTVGALVATRMFDRPLAVLRLTEEDHAALARAPQASLRDHHLTAEGVDLMLDPLPGAALELTAEDIAMRDGARGAALQQAMQVLCDIAVIQGARTLTDVARAHIDGCIYATAAHLRFAQTMHRMGAQVAVPTTTNAISVDHANWRAQGVDPDFGAPAQLLADTYVALGAQPTFTCAPYLLDHPPPLGEVLGWSESNAVIFANSVLGARSPKHADFLDLFIAMTGRAPLADVYIEANRRPRVVIDVDVPAGHDDALWPMLGWLAGQAAPDRIPVLHGLAEAAPSQDDLRALCAAFGTTSGAPMLHVAGVTPEAHLPPVDGAAHLRLGPDDLRRAWRAMNGARGNIDLVALGSPHLSLPETERFAELMDGARCAPGTSAILTVSQSVRDSARSSGALNRLERSGVQVVTDLCWCSITEPVFPPQARTLMTNSGKYAHYAPALCGREVRFGSLSACAQAAQTGQVPQDPPAWLR